MGDRDDDSSTARLAASIERANKSLGSSMLQERDDDDERSVDNGFSDEDSVAVVEETVDHLSLKCQRYYESFTGGKDVRVLFTMAIGLTDESIPRYENPPFSNGKNKKVVKPTQEHLQREVVRRFRAYDDIREQLRTEPRPKSWKIRKCITFLERNPIPLQEDLVFIKKELISWIPKMDELFNSQSSDADAVLRKKWADNIPFLRLYHVLIDDELRDGFGKSFRSLNREELDARKSDVYVNFYDKAAEKFNNNRWVPTSMLLPGLHPDFAQEHTLRLDVELVDGDELRKRVTDLRCRLNEMVSAWERSGSGKGMMAAARMSEEEGRRVSEEVYKFMDGDDRKNYVDNRGTHMLYLWHVSHEYGILDAVRQAINPRAAVDNGCAPSALGTRKRTKRSSEDDTATYGDRTEEISMLANIHGEQMEKLVDVARGDQLYKLQVKLDEVICGLRDSIAETELRIMLS